MLPENAGPSILNLDYRQGTDPPQLKHGFVDSHFICFPYETRRTGIYAAGPVRRPMDVKQAMEDAVGATNEDEQRYPLFNESRCRRDDDY